METEQYIKSLLEEIEALKKMLESSVSEENRKTYMATGFAALILETGDAKLIKKAEVISKDALELF